MTTNRPASVAGYRQPSPAEMFEAHRNLAVLYKQHELHKRLLCALCKIFSEPTIVSVPAPGEVLETHWRMCISNIAKLLKVNVNDIMSLRRRYPKTFQLMHQYEGARLRWEKSEKVSICAPETAPTPETSSVCDPLLNKLKELLPA